MNSDTVRDTESNPRQDCHIASLVVWVGERVSEVQEQLQNFDWVDCPLPPEQGKCVAVLEAATDQELIKRIDRIRGLPAVANAQLVYHVFDEAE